MTRQQWLDFAKKLRQKESEEIQEAVIEVSAPIWREANKRKTEQENPKQRNR